MCGIALILSGVHVITSSSSASASASASAESSCGGIQGVYEPILSVDELKGALRRRGPDHLGCKRICLYANCTAIIGGDGEGERKDDLDVVDGKIVAELCLLGATLQLRGVEPLSQPLVSPSGNVLVYNGEIFGGIHVADEENDAKSLLSALEMCCYCDCHALNRGKACSCCGNGGKSIPQVLSTIKGPWALIYWQINSKTMWFGRDSFGRRSLLVHWPTPNDSRFLLSSVSPPSSLRKDYAPDSTVNGFDTGADPGFSDVTKAGYWEELPCGMYSVHLKDLEDNKRSTEEEFVVEVIKHEWEESSLHKLIQWERKYLVPTVEDLSCHGNSVEKLHLPLTSSNSDEIEQNIAHMDARREHPSDRSLCSTYNPTQPRHFHLAHRVLIALRESVMLRTSVNRIFKRDLNELRDEDLAPIAVLFSGGLDSMILASLLDQCLNSKCTIDLLNVSFDGQLAPDRVSARVGLKELQRISPLRRWRLVEIDAALSNLKWDIEHVMSLIHPSRTYMDLNIGIALWLAAGGDGWVDGKICNMQEGHRYKYKSTSRVLLVGSGADEQCAGYGRHRTKYRLGGWIALDEEMRLDVQRIWKRNMGRDDRCISDHGKEARFPFLDENVMKTLLELPLWEIAKLDEPVGTGDKKILREVAKLLGLQEAALQPKRAIQFGSRIARESNRKNFGSNRAANQASAGSVEICQHMQ